MPKLSERGVVAQGLILLLLVAGIVFGVYLVQQKTNLFPKAAYISSPINPTIFGHSILLGNTGEAAFVKAPANSFQNPSANFTVEAWIRPDRPSTAIGNQDVYGIVYKTRSTSGDSAYGLELLATPQADGTILYNYQFRVDDGALTLVTADTSNGTVNDEQGRPINGFRVSQDEFLTWRHVAGVIRNGNLYIYSNGKLVAKNEFGMTSFGTSTAPLEIGARLLADRTHDSYYRGEIDEVRISDVARYQGNSTILLSPFGSDTNTLALYHFDDNFWDSSNRRNNAEARGQVILVNSAVGIRPPTPSPVAPVEPIPPIFPVPTPTPTPSPTPLPVLPAGNNWGAKSELVCNNGTTPSKPERTRLVYAIWPDEPYDLNNSVKFKRTDYSYDAPATQIISITNKLNVSSAYVGIEAESGEFLSPIGTPAHQNMAYAQFFGVNMVRWDKNKVPAGYYTIQFQAPSGWCQ